MARRTTTGRKAAFQLPPNSVYKLPVNLIRKVNSYRHEFSLFVNQVVTEGFGPAVVLNIKQGQRSSVGIDLTELSSLELVAISELLMRGLELAAPIVERRDEIAKQSIGSDSPFTRAYRTVPAIFVREGEVSLDGKSLLLRPVDVSTVEEQSADK